ncbi:hypothetical protein DPMN_094341 [Dreissena polymorpha]|uniref:Uncharacterized protein n=1 Tax=Dreissena polymorpha TaxID=45954 RepID=A0A9D4L5Y3_DREPO|nr:hypothetical protein DPMN_094341 [Dreissena polymorpha]
MSSQYVIKQASADKTFSKFRGWVAACAREEELSEFLPLSEFIQIDPSEKTIFVYILQCYDGGLHDTDGGNDNLFVQLYRFGGEDIQQQHGRKKTVIVCVK